MKRTQLKIRLVCLLTALLVAAPLLLTPIPAAAQPAAQETQAEGLTTPEELEAFMDGLAQAQLAGQHVAGMTVSVVKDGELFFAKGYGYADLAQHAPVEAGETLFRAGSISKLFVWTSVMQLVEQGRLDLDTDIRTYLDFELPTAYDEPITLRHLMTHTPGFEDLGEGLFVREVEELLPLREYLTSIMPRQVFPPGEISAYSNYGTTLAAYIVELESGLSFNEYVETNLLQPLGMARSSFRQPLPTELEGSLSKGYLYRGGQYEEGPFEYVVPYPVGSLSTTATDMAAFMIAHLQNGSYQGAQIIEAETAQAMHTLNFAHDPALTGYGLGFFVSPPDELRTAGHGGDTLLFHSEMQLLLDENVGIFISTNTDTGSLARFYLLQAFLDRYYPQDPLPLPDPSATLEDRAARYTGTYFPARRSFTRAEKVSTLFQPVLVIPGGDGRLAVSGLFSPGASLWFETGDGVFMPTSPDMPIRTPLVFRPASGDESGEISHLYLSTFAYIKQPWYAGQSFQFTLLGLGFLFFVGALIGVPTGALTRRRYERAAPEAILPMPGLARAARWAAWIFSLLSIVFVIWLVILMSDISNVIFGLPPGTELLLFIPWVQIVLAVLMVIFTLLAWLRGFWTVWGRVLYTLLTLFALGFVLFLWYWNLIALP